MKSHVSGYHTLAEPFTLENAIGQVREHFSRVDIVPYDDRLVVTDAEALVAYTRTMGSLRHTPRGVIEALEQDIRERVARDGRMEIEKDVGLLVAQ